MMLPTEAILHVVRAMRAKNAQVVSQQHVLQQLLAGWPQYCTFQLFIEQIVCGISFH